MEEEGAGASAAARPKKRQRRRPRSLAKWMTRPEDLVAVSEGGKLATQTANLQRSLTHAGEELAEGRHYWEVEIAGQVVGTYVGVCRPDADPRADHALRESTTAWLMRAATSSATRTPPLTQPASPAWNTSANSSVPVA